MKSKKKFFIIPLLILLLSFIFPSMNVFASTTVKDPWEIEIKMEATSFENVTLKANNIEDMTQTTVWNKIFSEYKGVIFGVSGVATLTLVVMFIFLFIKLGQTGANPQERKNVLTGLLWTGIAAAGIGSFALWVGFSYNLFH